MLRQPGSYLNKSSYLRNNFLSFYAPAFLDLRHLHSRTSPPFQHYLQLRLSNPQILGSKSMTDKNAFSPSVVEAIAGFTAGVISTLCFHPLDLIKTRLQGMTFSQDAQLSPLISIAIAMRRESELTSVGKTSSGSAILVSNRQLLEGDLMDIPK